jgi:hypothetical protein
MKRKHTSMILALQAQPMSSCHASIPWINDIINPRERLGKSETATCASHGSYGPSERLNCLKHTCTPRTDLRTNHASTLREHRSRGPTWWSADPRIGRTNHRSVDPGLPHDGSSLAPGQGARGLLLPVPWLINRRGGG